uniref:Inositol polyphosphate-related phosphatase domain-containing protein n=1 Tax=Trichogramma kaykai TaxID=54128 RepID=A0ABD2X3P3_9HYME
MNRNEIGSEKISERQIKFDRFFLYEYNSCNLVKNLKKLHNDKKLKIFIGSWNMNGRNSIKDLCSAFTTQLSHNPDIIVLSSQETKYCKNQEYLESLQGIIGASYCLKEKKQLGMITAMIFLKKELIGFASIIEVHCCLLNKLKFFKTKGAISLALMVFHTSFLFVTSHLSAHEKNIKTRISELEHIFKNLEFSRSLPLKQSFKDKVQQFDYIFLFGDLNFRTEEPVEMVCHRIMRTHFNTYEKLDLKTDQLLILMDTNENLKDYEEAPVTFPPTYKFHLKSPKNNLLRNDRAPSYTDRILFKSKKLHLTFDGNLSNSTCNLAKCYLYDSIRKISSSDHKPIFSIYEANLKSITY